MTADAYLNEVTNKIIAVPRQNLFQWTMSNIGKARIKGLDVTVHGRYRISKDWQLTAGVSYSFQEALDITNPLAYNYKAMLPYTPKHSGSVSLAALYRSFTWSYNIISSAYRYRQGDLLPVNLVQGWADHSTAIRYSLKTKQQGQYVLLAEINNIFNKQYEVIRYYPMPRLNYRVGITAHFKHHHKQQNIVK
jgi:outer membrane receptor protein involved in Fe transport